MEGTGGGWTVFQRRMPSSCNPPDYFNKDWNEYKDGFGDVRGEFWLGLEALHQLTVGEGDEVEARVTFKDFEGNAFVARLVDFKVYGEDDNYRMDASSYFVNGEQSSWITRNVSFTTIDRDNDNVA